MANDGRCCSLSNGKLGAELPSSGFAAARRAAHRVIISAQVLVVAACSVLSVQSAMAATGYSSYTDWIGWARYPMGEQAGIASSYDRDHANLDFSQYESPSGMIQDGSDVVIKTIEGPGIINRFWMPHLTAAGYNYDVRMYIDGDVVPRLDSDSRTILGGTHTYFTTPLVDTCAGGQVTYEPILFNESLRIETTTYLNAGRRHHYQLSYATFPPQTSVQSYTGVRTPEEQADRDDLVMMFNNVGANPGGPSPGAVVVSTPPGSIPAGATLSLLSQVGPGIVRRVNLRMDSVSDSELDALRLVVTYDTEPVPAIDVPVSQFFGAGHLRAEYASLPVGTDSPDGFYCYWPMPFRHAVSVELANDTLAAITIGSALVEYEPTSIGRDLCYLHADAHTHAK